MNEINYVFLRVQFEVTHYGMRIGFGNFVKCEDGRKILSRTTRHKMLGIDNRLK